MKRGDGLWRFACEDILYFCRFLFLAQIACKEAYCVEYIGSAAPIPNNYTWSCRWYTHLCREQLQIWQSFEVLMEQLSYLFLLTQKLWFWRKHCKVGHVRQEFMQKSKNPTIPDWSVQVGQVLMEHFPHLAGESKFNGAPERSPVEL